ncbi:TPA: hypothetical protein N0F65_005122 [Lagenidium giganteum]|uniref:Uncharacterized protein n=1 Tax=Lagenidium giganteum TaxID=4803 RepID=A0AAV2YZL8_9STRA|nr:TPA: hypothetical protein N0F65_005122 [Lagenidium giganteum]
MDAFFRGIVKNMSFGSGSGSASTAKPFAPVVCLADKHRVRQRQAATPSPTYTTTTPVEMEPKQRIAHWDNKREKCQNCNLIYLKTLSRHPGFCSVDCKSNAAYLDKVNRTIARVKDAVEQMQQDKIEEAAPVITEAPVAEEPEHEEEVIDLGLDDEDHEPTHDGRTGIDIVRTDAHTFAEFGFESRMLDGNNVEWAFSALY